MLLTRKQTRELHTLLVNHLTVADIRIYCYDYHPTLYALPRSTSQEELLWALIDRVAPDFTPMLNLLKEHHRAAYEDFLITVERDNLSEQPEVSLAQELILLLNSFQLAEEKWKQLLQETSQVHRLPKFDREITIANIVAYLKDIPADTENHKHPLLTFLMRFKEQVSDFSKTKVEAQLGQWALFWGIELDKARTAMVRSLLTPYRERLLVLITSESEDIPPDEQDYRLRVLHWRGPKMVEPWYDDKDTGLHKLDELPQQFKNALKNRIVPDMLEFFLPNGLLNYGIEQWQLGKFFGLTYGKKYRVVVRPLQRINFITEDSYFRDVWNKRWQIFSKVCSKTCALSLTQRELSSEELFNKLDNPDVACLFLAFQPNISLTGQQEDDLAAILSAGVPIALWPRQPEPTEHSLTCVDDMMSHNNLMDLPEHIKSYRDNSPRENRSHVGHHLTLLWDDPDILPLEHIKDNRFSSRYVAPA